MNTFEISRDIYKGIGWEIAHPHSVYGWAYYIGINLERIKDKNIAESLWITPKQSKGIFDRYFYNYTSHDFLGALKFHGGITYYSKSLSDGLGGENRHIKIGCDYSHYWDDGITYTLESIIDDIQETIDDLLSKVEYMTAEEYFENHKLEESK